MQAVITKKRILILGAESQVIAFADTELFERRRDLYPEGKLTDWFFITKFRDETVTLKFDPNLLIGGRTYTYNENTIICDRDFGKAEIKRGEEIVGHVFASESGEQYYTNLAQADVNLFLLTVYLLEEGLTSVPLYSHLAMGKRILDRLWLSMIVHGIFCAVLYLALLIIVESEPPTSSGDAINRVTLYLLTYFTLITYIVSYRETNKFYNSGVGRWVSNICIYLMFISFIITCITYMVDCNKDQYCFIREEYNFGVIPISSCVIYGIIVVFMVPFDVYNFLFK